MLTVKSSKSCIVLYILQLAAGSGVVIQDSEAILVTYDEELITETESGGGAMVQAGQATFLAVTGFLLRDLLKVIC